MLTAAFQKLMSWGVIEDLGKGKIMLDDEKTYDFDGTFGQDCTM